MPQIELLKGFPSHEHPQAQKNIMIATKHFVDEQAKAIYLKWDHQASITSITKKLKEFQSWYEEYDVDGNFQGIPEEGKKKMERFQGSLIGMQMCEYFSFKTKEQIEKAEKYNKAIEQGMEQNAASLGHGLHSLHDRTRRIYHITAIRNGRAIFGGSRM